MSRMFTSALVAAFLALVSFAQAAPPTTAVWTDPKDSTLPVDFTIQGEYTGEVDGLGKVGCQVIALGDGAFQAVVYNGGLPGAGWDGKQRSLLDGKLDGSSATFKAAEGTKKYLAASPAEFSATDTFPPEGQKSLSGAIADGRFTIKLADGKASTLEKTARKSTTLGVAAPQGAIVLFDGSNTEEWNGGRLDEKSRLLNTDGKDILTKRKFTNYSMHVEFFLPFRPAARGQGRGSSGFYQVDLYEVQILDSFGLAGKNNECGGVYTLAEPTVNMCLPPLAWQTYDVDFTSAKTDADGKITAKARLTARLNGVLIHDNIELSGPTGGSRKEPEGTPGPIKLQGHGNPLQFRNVWVVER